MATNKDRIERLEVELGNIQDSLSRMEVGVVDKIQRLEDTLSKLLGSMFSNQSSSTNNNPEGNSVGDRHRKEDSYELLESRKPMFSSKLARLEFPRFTGSGPTEWFTRVKQFFDYQVTPGSQKVPLASYHMEGEANQWWKWLKRAYKEENQEITWELFQDELWARFGPTEDEDYDEALSKIKQTGSLRDYQREFERLGNKVKGCHRKL